MPFNQCFPRAFNASSIRQHAPAVSGVYGLSNATEWVYIGETSNILHALLHHLSEAETANLKHSPTGFVFEVCQPASRAARQNQLIVEYKLSRNSQSDRLDSEWR